MIEQISKFVNVLNTAADGSSHRIKFSLQKFPSSTEFILTGDKLLYNKHIKMFHKIVRDMLYGNLDITSSRIDHLPAEPILFFDVHQFVWETINRISDEDIVSICKDIDAITVSKTSHPVKDFSLFSRDSIDSIVVFYFQVIPKPAKLFLQDFETTNKLHYFRSLIRMALLDYIKLESISAPSLAQKPLVSEELLSSTPRPVDLTEPIIKWEEPVSEQKIVTPPEEVKNEFEIKKDIEKQIEHILQEKPITPVTPVPTEKKKDGSSAVVSKVRIENLKKILRNIKQL